MKITKYNHACLLVEMPAPVNRTALFDPGTMSESVLDVDSLEYLDNIIITHNHPDHLSISLLKQLVAKFPDVRITSTAEVVEQLADENIEAVHEETPGIVFFDSPHAYGGPMFPTPQQIGVHYLDTLTHPGDNNDFTETKAILALPLTAPWGATTKAAQLALDLKPKYIVPIHDWQWRDEVRNQVYAGLEKLFTEHGITFIKPETGIPFVLNI